MRQARLGWKGWGSLAVGIGVLAGICAVLWAVLWAEMRPNRTLERAVFEGLYHSPLPRLATPPSVFHLGHSLVGRDMPAMVAQLTGGVFASQLGWGASLRQHWTGDVPGFAEENASAAFRPAREAILSGDYQAVVLTEMIDLADALRHHDSAQALADWALLARTSRQDVRVYLYETWHRWDDPAGWAQRVRQDRAALWEDGLLRPDMARGQVMAAVVAAAESGALPSIGGRAALFSDEIHLTDLGAYVVALTQYAVLMGRSPQGLPSDLRRADGTAADLPRDVAALQTLVWTVVQGDPMTGVAGQRDAAGP